MPESTPTTPAAPVPPPPGRREFAAHQQDGRTPCAPSFEDLHAPATCSRCSGTGMAGTLTMGWRCSECCGSGEVMDPLPTCDFCNLYGDTRLAVVLVEDWQGNRALACTDCLAAIEADPDGHGNARVVEEVA